MRAKRGHRTAVSTLMNGPENTWTKHRPDAESKSKPYVPVDPYEIVQCVDFDDGEKEFILDSKHILRNNKIEPYRKRSRDNCLINNRKKRKFHQ